jgi:uncharacterized membrane protein
MANEFSELYASVYKGFITTTIIAFIIGMTTNGLTSFGCYQAGYSIFALAIMLILLKLLNNYLKKTQGNASAGSTFLTISPFVLMLFCVGYLLYFNIKYKEIIIDGRVSNGYYTFSNISVILLLIQLSIVYYIVTSSTFDEKGVNPVTSSSILLLGILTAISVNIVYTILVYFTTDGFQDNILKI